MEKIMVSVICTCYNHEKYIRHALEGFVNQRTNFKYEVFVHDDASTDNSTSIIRMYEEKYPEIIRAIYQQENQYSKGVKIGETYIWPNLKGKYIAVCEGDDYWIDEYKLQKQVDFLENNLDFVACVHNCMFETMKGEQFVKYQNKDKELFLEDVIMCGSQSFQTASVMYRRILLENRPTWMSLIKGVGDYPAAINYVLNGRVMYFGAVMSVYRVATVGSWSARLINNTEKQNKLLEDTLNMLSTIDKLYNYKYTDIIQKAKLYQEYMMLLNRNDAIKYIKNERYKVFYDKEAVWTKIKWHLKCYFPFLLRIRSFIRY